MESYDISVEKSKNLIAFRSKCQYLLSSEGEDAISAFEKEHEERSKKEADRQLQYSAERSEKKRLERKTTRRYWFDKLFDLAKILIGAVIGAVIQYKTSFFTRIADIVINWLKSL